MQRHHGDCIVFLELQISIWCLPPSTLQTRLKPSGIKNIQVSSTIPNTSSESTTIQGSSWQHWNKKTWRITGQKEVCSWMEGSLQEKTCQGGYNRYELEYEYNELSRRKNVDSRVGTSELTFGGSKKEVPFLNQVAALSSSAKPESSTIK